MTKARSDPTGQQKGIPAASRGAGQQNPLDFSFPRACAGHPPWAGWPRQGGTISMNRSIVRAGLLAAACLLPSVAAYSHEAEPTTAAATGTKPVPKEQLLAPPASAERYVVVSDAGQHGQMWHWTLPDGRQAARYSQSLRGWITETDAVYRTDRAGRLTDLTVRGITPGGDAAERFTVEGTKASWSSTIDGKGQGVAGGYYFPASAPGVVTTTTIEQLVAAGKAGVALLPAGRATLERTGTMMTVTGPGGPKQVE